MHANGHTNLVVGEFSRTLLELPFEKEYPFKISGMVCLFDKGTCLAVVHLTLIPFISLYSS